MPQQGWVSVHRAARGLTIANRGLPEYELQPDESGTLALTILRAEGWLSRDDLLTRQGGAGAHIPTPDAQALGLNRAAYAVVPHAGDWLSSGSYRTAEEYLAPLYGSFVTAAHGAEPWSRGLISLEGDHTLVLSAVKKAENSEYLVLRFWNVGERETEARLAVHRPLAEARLLDLKEDPVSSELQIEEEGIVLRAGPAQIVTLGLRFQGRERE
jgi:mannosylglycerate hydrolase